MKLPNSTYRVQLWSGYPLEELSRQIDYLNELGISTIYAAPLFTSRRDSTHGYDVLDPYTINKEIGSLQSLRQLSEVLRQKGMNWLQDIVPNHMAFDGNNPWLRDIFELGPASDYYQFFDIDWQESGKVMAPFLGAPLEEVLEKREIQMKYDQSGFSVTYFEHSYPASAQSYLLLLKGADVGEWKEKFQNFSDSDNNWEDLKMGFFRDVQGDQDYKSSIAANLEKINGSPEILREILELQFFVPVHWKQTESQINYRRFFTINDLICLRMEDRKVFDTYHHFIKELRDQEIITSLRIDHIDGLFDPKAYLQDLRSLMGKDTYIVVEKILESEEELPKDWPVQGSSGYDFLAQVNHLFTDTRNRESFTEAYTRINPEIQDYEELVYEKKLFILNHRMGGELQNLWLLAKERELLPGASEEAGKKALATFLAGFPVYRIYPQEFPLSEAEEKIIQLAFDKALAHMEKKEILGTIKSVFLGKAAVRKEDQLYFLQRCQQFTGPLAAKGVEDTAFYIYNLFIAHNEVGDSPENFGLSIKDFHQKMQHRREKLPYSINATATHDTKRGEDARMRLNVLSELPQEWLENYEEWRKITDSLKSNGNGPDANEEYFIYQTLLGGYPFSEEEDLTKRVKAYLQKALREAKIHSNWAEPDEAYETAVFTFVEDILASKDFRSSFDPFQEKLAHYGAIKSLGQCLIKVTAPGIPDIYQGTEFWDLSFVDPDNRRPVDYLERQKVLEELTSGKVDPKQQLDSLKTSYRNGNIKLYTLSQALRFRREHPELFEEGDYIPLEVKGEFSEAILAYARKTGHHWAVVIAPVLVTQIFRSNELSPEEKVLENVYVELPEGAPENLTNIFSGEASTEPGKIFLKKVLQDFPVALLTNL